MEKLVSIITPGWNGVTFIHRLLDSILNQTYKHIQYIYVDDGSYDGTKEVVLKYEQKFIKNGIEFLYVYQENKGVSAAINTGLKYVKGEFLCWVEYDDILTDDSIGKKVNYLSNHINYAVVTSDAYIVKEEDISKTIGLLANNNKNRFETNHFVHLIMNNSIFVAGTHMVRMDIFDETHKNRTIYPSRRGPNWQMLLPLLYKYNRGFIDEPLLYYVIRKESISHSVNSVDSAIEVLDDFENTLYCVLSEINMESHEREKYKKLVLLKYAKERFILALECKNKLLIKEQFLILKKNNAITLYFLIKYFVSKSELLEFVFKKIWRILVQPKRKI